MLIQKIFFVLGSNFGAKSAGIWNQEQLSQEMKSGIKFSETGISNDFFRKISGIRNVLFLKSETP